VVGILWANFTGGEKCKEERGPKESKPHNRVGRAINLKRTEGKRNKCAGVRSLGTHVLGGPKGVE